MEVVDLSCKIGNIQNKIDKREARKEAGFQVCCHHGQWELLLGSEKSGFLPPASSVTDSPLPWVPDCGHPWELQGACSWKGGGVYAKEMSSNCKRSGDLEYHKETSVAQSATDHRGYSCRSMSHTAVYLWHSRGHTQVTRTAANCPAIVSNDLLSIAQCRLPQIKSCDPR